MSVPKLPPAVEASIAALIREVKDGPSRCRTLLFTGPRGAGKSVAAERVATALDLDLFRVDLGRVVGKYLGEIEERLDRVFDAAEAVGAVLFFDEADAVFGERSDVRDAHDRYANHLIDQLATRLTRHALPVLFACAGRPCAKAAARLAARQAAFSPLRARALAASRARR